MALAIRRIGTRLAATLSLCWLFIAQAAEYSEYQVKAAYLYNFTSYTHWPENTGDTLNLCVYDQNPFGEHLQQLHGRKAGDRILQARHITKIDLLADCQVIFLTRSVRGDLPRILQKLKGRQILTVADSPSAARTGVALNMGTQENRITFEANLAAVQDNGLSLSSKLLYLATDVIR